MTGLFFARKEAPPSPVEARLAREEAGKAAKSFAGKPRSYGNMH